MLFVSSGEYIIVLASFTYMFISTFNSTKNSEQAKGKTSVSGSSSKGHKSSSSKDDAGGELHKNGSAGSSPKSEGGAPFFFSIVSAVVHSS
jgi:hypothetical protein